MPATASTPVASDRDRRRRDRELATLHVMIRMYCRDHHAGDPLCADCAAIASYATRRLTRCVFGAAKPTCANCTVHCYSADMRERGVALYPTIMPALVPWAAKLSVALPG